MKPGLGVLPLPKRHWFHLHCPLCRGRIHDPWFITMTAYKVHYLQHVGENLERHVEVLAKGGNPRPWDGSMSGPLRTLLRRPDD